VPTQEKITTVEELRQRLDGAKAVVLTEYRGLTVKQLSELRKQLRAVHAEYKVVKNRLARIAGTAVGLEGLRGDLTGPTALAISREDPVALARTLATFARTNQALAIKAGYVEGQVLPPTEIRALSELPSKEALRAQIVGLIQGPLAQLVGLLAAPNREIAYVLAERGKGAGGAEGAEAAAETGADGAVLQGSAG
jgi:large subunit ribosomal protein L10